MSDTIKTEQLAAATASSRCDCFNFDSNTLKDLLKLGSLAQSVVTTGDVTTLVVPEGYAKLDLTEAIEKAGKAPSRKKGTIVLRDLDSFLTFTQQQGNPERTRIYADVESRTLTAVFNDHASIEHGDQTGWRDYRAVYTAELSKEFETWLKHSGVPMDQEPFAIFLEDNIADVVEPSGDKLLTVALTLQAKTEASFNSSRRLDNGQVQLEYTENISTTAGGAAAMEVPREFAIGARLFKGGEGYRIRARLKLRVGQGKVKFWYELDRPHIALEEAFAAYVNQARAGKFTVLHGKV